MKPSPPNIQDLALKSFESIGLSPKEHDFRFVEDDWESPTLGAAGLGWEVWCDGMEILQFTYFQQIGGMALDPITAELTYGLERIALFLQNKENVFDLDWNGVSGDARLTYGDIYHKAEKQFSHYHFEEADVPALEQRFQFAVQECEHLLQKGLPLPAYDRCIHASHLFNMLDARGALSVSERAKYIGDVRALAMGCFKAWRAQTEGTAA
jgi:glycyl-tRNA synthetase alpha chain